MRPGCAVPPMSQGPAPEGDSSILRTFRLIRAKRSFTPTMGRLLTRAAGRGDTQRVALVPDALRLLGVLVTYPVSRRPVRPLAGEAMRSLPGDELVADAKIRWNHAITIRAHPADVWPWLVQMGCRRAGWYSYDGLDNGGVPARSGSFLNSSGSMSATSCR